MRRWRWVVLAATVGIGLAVAGSAGYAALAGTPGTLPGNGSYVGGVTFAGPEPLVLWNLPGSGGHLGTCIDANVNGPLTGPYSRESSVSDAVYAELNHLYANASTSDVQLAELSALSSLKYDLVDPHEQWGYVTRGEGGLSESDADAMLAHARALAGPYTVAVTWPTSATAVDTPYTATVTVRSAAGNPVPGLPVALSGAAVTLAATSAVTNSAGQATVGFRFPAGASATGTINATVPEWTTLDRYRSSGEQTMLSLGAAARARGTHSAAITRTRDVRLIKVAAGDSSQTPVAGYVFRITAANGTVVVASVTTTSTPVDVAALQPGQSYRATEIAVPAGAKLYIPANPTWTFTVPAGTGEWTLVAADPRIPTPTVRTTTNLARAVIGQRLSDRVSVAGDDGENGTVTAQLLGPVAVPRSGRCSDVTLAAYRSAASRAFTARVDGAVAGGNGTVTVVGPVVAHQGCYGWAETLTLIPSRATATSPPTAPNESTVVTAPAVGTVVSAQIAAPGLQLHDTVTVRGLNGETATLIADLYGPLRAAASTGCAGYDDAAWRAAIKASPATLLVKHTQTSITGDGVRIVGPVTVTRLGCYTYVEELIPTATGESGAVRTSFGQPSESTVVLAPQVATAASAGMATPGGSLRDRVRVTGLAGVPMTITGVLLGPVPPHGGSCLGLDWISAPVAGSIPALSVHTDGRYLTGAVRTARAGCYTFVEAMRPVSGSPLVSTPAGQRPETVLVSRGKALADTGAAVGSWLWVGATLSLLGVGLLVGGTCRRRLHRWG